MARKSKGFSELLHQKQHKEQKISESFERLQQKVKESVGEEVSRNMVFNPTEVNKMSDVLEEFIDPYIQATNGKSELENLLKIAVLTWNIALMPPEERQDAIDSILSEMASETDRKVLEDLQTVITDLIDRKDRYFSSCRRSITSFDLQDQGDGYFLSVASTLEA